MGTSAAGPEERLREIARGDLSGISALIESEGGSREASGLSAETFRLVQIAALAAVDGSPVSWLLHLGAAERADLDLDKMLGTLVAIAPIIGTPRVVSAGSEILRAIGLAEAGDP